MIQCRGFSLYHLCPACRLPSSFPVPQYLCCREIFRSNLQTLHLLQMRSLVKTVQGYLGSWLLSILLCQPLPHSQTTLASDTCKHCFHLRSPGTAVCEGAAPLCVESYLIKSEGASVRKKQGYPGGQGGGLLLGVHTAEHQLPDLRQTPDPPCHP